MKEQIPSSAPEKVNLLKQQINDEIEIEKQKEIEKHSPDALYTKLTKSLLRGIRIDKNHLPLLREDIDQEKGKRLNLNKGIKQAIKTMQEDDITKEKFADKEVQKEILGADEKLRDKARGEQKRLEKIVNNIESRQLLDVKAALETKEEFMSVARSEMKDFSQKMAPLEMEISEMKDKVNALSPDKKFSSYAELEKFVKDIKKAEAWKEDLNYYISNKESFFQTLLDEDIETERIKKENPTVVYTLFKIPSVEKQISDLDTKSDSLEEELSKLNAQLKQVQDEGYAETFLERFSKKSKKVYDNEVAEVRKNIGEKEKEIEKHSTGLWDKRKDLEAKDSLWFDYDTPAQQALGSKYADQVKQRLERSPKNLKELFDTLKVIITEEREQAGEIPKGIEDLLGEWKKLDKEETSLKGAYKTLEERLAEVSSLEIK